MAIFRSKDSSNQVKNVKTKKLTKVYSVREKQVIVDYIDAPYGEVNGEEVLLDEESIVTTQKELMKVFLNHATKYNPVPSRVIVSHQEKREVEKEDNQQSDNKQEFTLSVAEPRYTFDEMYLPDASRKQISRALTIEKNSGKLMHEWGLASIVKYGRASVLNFFGPPGTGKSMAAEAIANDLGKKVLYVNYAQLESKYVGETPKNIKKCFATATEQDAILIFDEADSFLGKRLTNVTQSADYGVNVTRSVMLMELEKFTGVVVFTTNLITNYDQAFKRRILANIEFALPDEFGLERIWESHLPEQLPLQAGITPKWLANKFENISGADIKDIVLYAAANCIERSGETLLPIDFEEAYTYICNRYSTGKNVTITSEVITEEQYRQEIGEPC